MSDVTVIEDVADDGAFFVPNAEPAIASSVLYAVGGYLIDSENQVIDPGSVETGGESPLSDPASKIAQGMC